MGNKEIRSACHPNRPLITERDGSIAVSEPVLEANTLLNPKWRTQKFILIWLDSTIDKTDADYHDLLAQVKKLGITYKIFTDVDECIESLTQMTNEKVILILNGFIGERVMDIVHDMAHVDSIYAHCANARRHERWTKKWSKIKGVLTDIYSICDIIKQNQQMEPNLLAIRPLALSEENELFLGFLAVGDDVQSKNLDELDPSFMFTTVLKEILLGLEYNEISMQNLVALCREKYLEDEKELAFIDEFEKAYYLKTPISWYTHETFLYKMLNLALRTLDVKTIIKMGFFLHDLHSQIVQLYNEQFTKKEYSYSFIVYRGQALIIKDFDMLMKSVGGLISFNNFLSTTRMKDIALQFAYGGENLPGRVGILFIIDIDPSNSSTVFADITNISYYKKESEILFSMHSVFRIKSIEKTGKNMYQVNLTSTNDEDQQLHDLTDLLREETLGLSGWDRIGKLLIKLGDFYAAQETYNTLLERTTNDVEQAHFYHQLGYIKEDLGEYDDSLSFYEKSLEIKQRDPPSDGSHFAMYYNNIGAVYDKKGDYSTAAAFFLKAIDIYERILPRNAPRLATCYNNIGSIYYNMCEYSKVLSYYDKELAIDLECLPENDPSLGIDHNNIGLVYLDMQEYESALSCFQKALAIYNRSLQPGHASFSSIYNSLGSVYNSIEEYSKALSYYQKALEIDQNTLAPNHPYLGITYNNMGLVYKNMNEYAKALSMFECALNIEKSAQSPNETRIEQYTKNIVQAKDKLNP